MTDSDKMLLAQLPDECVIENYKNFLYKDFLFKFRRLFNLSFMPRRFFGFMQKKTDDTLMMVGEWTYSRQKLLSQEFGQLPFPYYTFNTKINSSFMIQLMNALELRTFKDNEIIANEQDEALEVLFIDRGTYDVGYEINKTAFYKRRFGPSTTIGGFQVCYRKRFSFVYKSHSNLRGLAVRKEKFIQIITQFHNIYIQIKLKFWEHFS